MKLRIADRILVALAGLLLIACCVGMIAQMFFGLDLIVIAGKIFSSESVKIRAALIALSVFLFFLGLYCLFVLFRHRKRKDKFILQKNEGGELAISLKALENMVNKCLDQHKEIHVQNLHMENQKDGLLIRLRGSVAGGISIPLTVEALQRQIKQYVTACSGVEVKGIRVQIDASDKEAKNATFVIEGPAQRPLLSEDNGKIKEQSETFIHDAPVPVSQESDISEGEMTETAIPEPVKTDIPEMIDDEDDRPLHQRLFKSKEEPCIVPAPPEESGNTAETGEQEDAAETAERYVHDREADDSDNKMTVGNEAGGERQNERNESATVITDDQAETDTEIKMEDSETVTVGAEEQINEPIETDTERSDPEKKNAEKTAFEVSQNAFDHFVTGDRNPEVNGYES